MADAPAPEPESRCGRARGPAAPAGNLAFYFLREGYETDGKRLMGRHAAGEGFLRGWSRHARVDRVWGYAPAGAQSAAFQEIVSAAGAQAALASFSEPQRLAEPGAVFMPGPTLARLAWTRRRIDQRGWSILGVTHTTASDRVMETLGEIAAAPLQSWDALVCTSSAVRAMVVRALDQYAHYFESAFGARDAKPRFETPIIPLGVDTDALDPATDDARAARAAWRGKLAIEGDDIVLLWVGRMTHAAKANPWPMYRAAEAAQAATGKRIHIVEAGWVSTPFFEQAFAEAHQAAAPSTTRHVLDGREPDVRTSIWYAADVFCSFADNIQETFGLTPIEAMAAGLPVLVTDWDGYRDTVRDGVDGVRVPTLAPEPGAGGELAMLYETEAMSYDQYCLAAANATAVDIRRAAEALIALVRDPGVRARMGAAARRRAVETYDWRHIVAAYQALTIDLAARRHVAPERAAPAATEPRHPLRDDPFTLFAAYPSRVASGLDRVSAAGAQTRARAQALMRLKLFAGQNAAIIDAMTTRLAKGDVTIDALAAELGLPTARLARPLLWLAKTGLVTITRAGTE